MSIGLNVGNSFVRYDLRINEYIDLNQFDGQLIINCSLPYFLPKMNEVYCISVMPNQFESNLFRNESRKIVFAGTRNWINNQPLAARHSTIEISSKGNTVLSTTLVIAIELKKEEFFNFSQIINSSNVIETELKLIMQNALEIILYKFNELCDGKSFITPSYFYYDRIHILFLKNYFYKRLLIWEYIAPNDINPANSNIDETAFSFEEINQEILTWRYFNNKSNYHFMCYEFLDSIISAAIAIESFAYSLVKTFCSTDNEVQLYTSEIVKNKNDDERPVFLTMHKLIKKLKDDKKINTSLSNNQIDKHISRVLNPRNDIMHGKMPINTPLRLEAKKVNESLNVFFNSIIHIPEIRSFDNIQNFDFNEYYKLFNYLNDNNMNNNDKEKITKDYMQKYPNNIYFSFIYSTLLFKKGAYNESKILWDNIIIRSKNKCHISIEIALLCISQKEYKLALEILNIVPKEQIDERYSTIKSLIFLKIYQKDKNDIYLKYSVNEINKSFNIKSGYFLKLKIALEIAIETNNLSKSIEYAQLLAKYKEEDYESVLFCAECYQKMNLFKECFSEFSCFLKRYELNKHSHYQIDFYEITYNAENIYFRAKSVLEYLAINFERDKIELIKELRDKLLKLKDRSLEGHIYRDIPIFLYSSEKGISSHLIKMNIPSLGVLGNVKDTIISKCW